MSQNAAGSGDRIEIDWLRAIAGALAAVASAILLSTLGAAGTIIGAAIGSLVVTVGSALITNGMKRGGQGAVPPHASAQEQIGIAQAELHRAELADDPEDRESHLDQAAEHFDEANQELDAALAEQVAGHEPTSWRTRLRGLPWGRIVWVSLALFVVAIVLITVFELLVGRSVASFTGGTSDDGGTTISNVGGGSDDDQPEPGPSESPAPSESPTPSGEPTPTAPASSEPPTPTPTPTPSETASISPLD